MIRKKLVVLTGSGISAESGIRTFRDTGGLWEEYDVMTVASYDGWLQNPELVLKFYNDRRKQLKDAKPNQAHIALAEAEKYFDVRIITQNVDNLHERAGSSKILHLHGELTKVESSLDSSLVHDIGYAEVNLGDKCEKGSQLRPHIVWFGEPVPAMTDAIQLTQQAEIYAVVGTSLNVYPAAGLIDYVPRSTPIYLVDPNVVIVQSRHTVHYIKENATVGVEKMLEMILRST